MTKNILSLPLEIRQDIFEQVFLDYSARDLLLSNAIPGASTVPTPALAFVCKRIFIDCRNMIRRHAVLVVDHVNRKPPKIPSDHPETKDLATCSHSRRHGFPNVSIRFQQHRVFNMHHFARDAFRATRRLCLYFHRSPFAVYGDLVRTNDIAVRCLAFMPHLEQVYAVYNLGGIVELDIERYGFTDRKFAVRRIMCSLRHDFIYDMHIPLKDEMKNDLGIVRIRWVRDCWAAISDRYVLCDCVEEEDLDHPAFFDLRFSSSRGPEPARTVRIWILDSQNANEHIQEHFNDIKTYPRALDANQNAKST